MPSPKAHTPRSTFQSRDWAVLDWRTFPSEGGKTRHWNVELRFCVRVIKEKLKERGADYKVLNAFSEFAHPETNATFTESTVNDLQPSERIEDRFEGDDYRRMVAASKFQTGFDQPLLAGMFLDKPVQDRSAVQAVAHFAFRGVGRTTRTEAA